MRSSVWTMTRRTIRTSKSRFFALFMITLLSVGFYSGLKVCKPQFWNAGEKYINRQHLYDLRIFKTTGISEDDLEELKKFDGVDRAEGQFATDVQVSKSGDTAVFRLRSLPEKVNLPSLVSGRMPKGKRECLVDARAGSYATLGKHIKLSTSIPGYPSGRFKVVGLVNAPTELHTIRGMTCLGSGKIEGFLYVKSIRFTTPVYSEANVTLKGSDKYEIYSNSYKSFVKPYEKKLKNRIEASTVLTREENAGYTSFQNDTSIIDSIADIFPIFFILIALLVCMTTMMRMVEEERTIIGTLKALGYSNASIQLKFLLYAWIPTLFGWVIGFFAGTYGIPKAFWAAYGSLYDFIGLTYTFDLKLAMTTLAVSLAAVTVSVLAISGRELNHQPASLMRPKANKPGKKLLLEHLTRFWNSLSFLRKATIRNMFRHKLHMAMMLIGISCSAALVVTAFGVRDSMINVGSWQYSGIQRYSIAVTVDPDQREDVAKKLKKENHITRVTEASSLNAEIKRNGKQMKNVTIIGFPSKSASKQAFHLTTWEGDSDLSLPSGKEVLISRRLSQKLSGDKGKHIRISTGEASSIVTSSGKDFRIRVGGVFKNYIGNYVMMNSDAYHSMAKELGASTEEGNTLLLRTSGKLANAQFKRINKMEGVSGMTDFNETRDQVNNALSCLNQIIWLLIAFSGALAFVVIYNLTGINIAERTREIATVKVLGFYPKEEFAYVLRENIALSLVSTLIGLPLGLSFCRFVVDRILIDTMTFPVKITPLSYAGAFVLSMIFAEIVNLFMRRRIHGVKMAESLKAVE